MPILLGTSVLLSREKETTDTTLIEDSLDLQVILQSQETHELSYDTATGEGAVADQTNKSRRTKMQLDLPKTRPIITW